MLCVEERATLSLTPTPSEHSVSRDTAAHPAHLQAVPRAHTHPYPVGPQLQHLQLAQAAYVLNLADLVVDQEELLQSCQLIKSFNVSQ